VTRKLSVSLCVFRAPLRINTDGSAADVSAILDLQSTTGGFTPTNDSSTKR
jgi:hypothetical protein